MSILKADEARLAGSLDCGLPKRAGSPNVDGPWDLAGWSGARERIMAGLQMVAYSSYTIAAG